MAISRILSGRGLRRGRDGHLSRSGLSAGPVLADCDYYPELPGGLRRRIGQATRLLLFCLAPHGVFRAPVLAPGAVGFYPAFSPLPPASGGRFFFCDTVRERRLSPMSPARFTRHAALRCPDFPLPAGPFGPVKNGRPPSAQAYFTGGWNSSDQLAYLTEQP